MPTEKAEAKVEKAEVKETAAKATTKKLQLKRGLVKIWIYYGKNY